MFGEDIIKAIEDKTLNPKLSMKASFRILYRQLILIISCCLLVTALTGIIVGLNNRLIQLPDQIVRILIGLHQGAFLGDKLAPIYVLLLGLGVFALGLKVMAEGKYNNLPSESTAPIFANVCRIIGLILVIPLAVCVETGIAYRLGADWLGMSSSETAGFLSVHGGYSFETPFDLFYLLAVGATLIALLILSWKSNKIVRKRSRQTSPQQSKTALGQNSTADRNKVFSSRKVRLTVVYALVTLLVLYYLTSALFVAIATVVIVAIVFVVVLGKKLIRNREPPIQAPTILEEQEAESITMLRAIPDSMLRVSQSGMWLSYIPAKEANSFVLDGDIVNKHIGEFLASKIAGQFMASIQSSLQTGSTNICRFSISADNEEQYFEARVSPIGEVEVLILVRQIDNSNLPSVATQHFVPRKDTTAVPILTESELIQTLETKLSNDKKNHKKTNRILLCLTIYSETNNSDVFAIGNSDVSAIDANSIAQIAARVNSLLPSSTIARFDENDLIILVSDRSMEAASTLVDDLYRQLNKLLLTWQNNFCSVEFNIALLEINADSPNVTASIDAAKAACQMAKQKINLKTF